MFNTICILLLKYKSVRLLQMPFCRMVQRIHHKESKRKGENNPISLYVWLCKCAKFKWVQYFCQFFMFICIFILWFDSQHIYIQMILHVCLLLGVLHAVIGSLNNFLLSLSGNISKLLYSPQECPCQEQRVWVHEKKIIYICDI